MGKLNVVMEAYPDLKASSNMQQLSEELTSTENRVAFARQGFNDAVYGLQHLPTKFSERRYSRLVWSPRRRQPP